MAEYTAGVVAVPVIPSFKNFHKTVGKEFTSALGAAGLVAGDAAGKSIGTRVKKSTNKVGADVGTSIASGIAGTTAKVGDLVGRRIHSGLGAAIARTGESAGLRIGTGLESAIGSSMARVEARGKTMGSRIYTGVRAPLVKLGAVSAGVFGQFGLNASAAMTLAGVAAVGMGVKFDAGLEQATQGFTTMLGSAQRAKRFLDSLQAFAASTPFEFPELVTASQRLIAFGFNAKQIIPTLTAIGDTAAGLGAGAEGVNQIVNAIGQIQAKGKVQSDELLQLTEVGVPALRILANQFGVSTAKMQQMVTDGVVPASKAIPALLTGLEKGTKGAAGQTTAFSNLMQKQSTTLVGVWSNFVDVANRKLGQLVAPALPFVKSALSGLTGIMQTGLGSLVPAKSMGTAVSAIKSVFTSIRTFVTSSLLPSLRNLGTALAPSLHAVGGLMSTLVLPGFRTFGGILNGVIGPALRSTTGFLAAHKVALEALLAAVAAGTAAYVAMRAPLFIMTGIVRGIGLATRAWAAAQALLNIVMEANPIVLVITAIVALGAALVVAFNHVGWFHTAMVAAWHGISAAASVVWGSVLHPVLSAIVTAVTAVATAATWLWKNVLGPVFAGIGLAARIMFAVVAVAVLAPLVIAFNILKAVVLALWNVSIKPFFTLIKIVALAAWPVVKFAIDSIVSAFKIMGAEAMWLWHNAISPAIHGIATAATWLWNNALHPTFSAIAWAIKNIVAPVFKWLYAVAIKPTWQAIGALIKLVWNTSVRPTFENLKLGIKLIREAFSAAVPAISKIWKGIESATRKPVQFVVDIVYNNGIRKVWNTVAGLVHLPTLSAVKFARGGINEVLPGYTPGRDPHQFYSPTGGRVDMSGGEAIMRPEFTRAVGPRFVYGLNAIARKRGVNGVREALGGGQAFADGGVYGGPVQRFAFGGILDAVKHAGSLVVHGASSLLDGGASLLAKHILDPILGKIPGADSTFAKAIYSLPKRMIDGFIGWLKTAVDPKLGGDPLGVVAQAKKFVGVGDDRGPNNNQWTRAWGMPGAPWCAIFVSDMIKRAGAQKHYPGYPTAAVAGYNGRMRHVSTGDGRAGDLGVYGGGSHINIIAGKKGGAYDTYGGNQNAVVQHRVRGGQTSILRPKYAQGGVLPRQAYQVFRREAPNNADPHELQTPLVRLMRSLPAGQMSHVARAIQKQGLTITNAGVYDDGGVIPPGLNLVANASRKPEALLSNQQWATLAASGAGGGDVHQTTYHLTNKDITLAQLEALQRRQEALARVGRPH